MNDAIVTVLISAGSAIVGGIVTAWGGPEIKWNIEKRRDRLNRRRDLITNARYFLRGNNNLTREFLRQSPDLSAIRHHLPTNIIRDMQLEIVGGEISLKEKILAEIAKLEKEWKLV